MKRNIRKKKKPMVPKNIVKSKIVGEYMPHDEGRKSRWRLIGMMMKRSSHIPTLTNMATTKSAMFEWRTRLIQTTCGTTTLQRMSSQ